MKTLTNKVLNASLKANSSKLLHSKQQRSIFSLASKLSSA